MDVGTIASGIMSLQHAGSESGSSLLAMKQKIQMEQAVAQMIAEATEAIQSSEHAVDLLV